MKFCKQQHCDLSTTLLTLSKITQKQITISIPWDLKTGTPKILIIDVSCNIKYSIIIKLMAFVFRSDKPQQQGKPNAAVGPGI